MLLRVFGGTKNVCSSHILEEASSSAHRYGRIVRGAACDHNEATTTANIVQKLLNNKEFLWANKATANLDAAENDAALEESDCERAATNAEATNIVEQTAAHRVYDAFGLLEDFLLHKRLVIAAHNLLKLHIQLLDEAHLRCWIGAVAFYAMNRQHSGLLKSFLIECKQFFAQKVSIFQSNNLKFDLKRLYKQ